MDRLERMKRNIRKKKQKTEGNQRVLMEVPVSYHSMFVDLAAHYKQQGKVRSQKDLFMKWIEKEHKKLFPDEH